MYSQNKWKAWIQWNNSLIFKQLYCARWIISVFTSSYHKKEKIPKAKVFFKQEKSFCRTRYIAETFLSLENFLLINSLKPFKLGFKNTLFSYIKKKRKPFFSSFLSSKTIFLRKKILEKEEGVIVILWV